jgi:TPR repeat protein
VTLGEAIGRLQANAATPADMALIEKKAIAGDKAAVEVLAWSYAEGRGHPADPVRAFRLYGLAAEIGVANARRNQEAVFLSMSGDLRQQVLDEANRQAQRTR